MVIYRCLFFRMVFMSMRHTAVEPGSAGCFKPVTLLLLLLFAWQSADVNAISYLVLAGLCASLIGDALTLLPASAPAVACWGAFFLSHLFYTICFASQMTLSSSGRSRWCCW